MELTSPVQKVLVPLAIYLFVIFSFAGQVRSQDGDPLYEACREPTSCGDGQNITYPFWIPSQPAYCGYPGFNLTCKSDQPVFQTFLGDFKVLKIDYENQFLTVVNQTLEEDCQLNIFTIPFRSPFRVRPNQPSLLFDSICDDGGRAYQYHRVNCSTNRTLLVYDGDDQFNSDNYLEYCKSELAVPVLEESVAQVDLSNPWKLLRKGFLLQWSVTNCSDCRRSGGVCGYDYDESRFMCMCHDRAHRVRCKSKSKSEGAIIGVSAAAAIGILAVVGIIFFCYRRKRHVAASSVLLTRKISRDGSSTYDLEKSSTNNSMHYPTHVFSYKELEEATNNFDESRELGDGGFGTVYYGKLKDGRAVAVKRLYENNYKRVEQFLNEVHILSSLRHQNLVSLYGCTSRHSRELLLVYEYIPNGTVADHLHGDRAKDSSLTWPVRLSIAVETAEALSYLHAIDPPIIHRDVKTNNILLDNNFRVKVADFGLSRLFPLDVTHVSTTPQGTPGYVDPDYHKCYQLTDKSDVYSFGVVLAELISSQPAVDITRHRHEINLAMMAINKIQSGALGEFVDPALGYHTDFKVSESITCMAELTFSCLREEKDDRPSMEEVVKELHRIARRANGVVTGTEEMDNLSDDVGLLKNIPPRSPDSVMDPWGSKLTTPNTSS